MKVDVERFGYNNPFQDFKFMKIVVKKNPTNFKHHSKCQQRNNIFF